MARPDRDIRTGIAYVATMLLTIFVVGAAGFGYIRQQKRFVIEEKRTELTTIADLKASQIIQWRTERLNEAQSIFANAMMPHRINDYVRHHDRTAWHEIEAWMKTMARNGGYKRVVLVTPAGGLIGSADGSKAPLTTFQSQMVAMATAEKQVIFTDLHREPATAKIEIDLFIPLLYQQEGQAKPLAVLALIIDPYQFLYPLIQSWPTPSTTAETLLVERQGESVLFLNELRHRKETALAFRGSVKEKDMPAARAVLGQQGAFEGVDYRGERVISALRTIPDSPWALVAKVDRREVFSTKRIYFLAAACIILVVAVSLAMSMWWMRRQGIRLRSQYETERRLNSELKEAEGSLQEARNRLEQRVTERTRKLMETNRELRQEMNERERLEKELVEAKQLESIGQIAGGVAHEVRNPLNAILTISEALFREKGIEDNPDYQPYIEHIRTQVNRLAQLMNDLLDLGKSIPAANLQPVPLTILCNETISLWSVGTTNVSARLTSEGLDRIQVMADPGKLQQVFLNLLDNAAQHSQAQSEILIRASIEGEMAIVRIIDSGRGIPEEKLGRIFDPFYTDRKGGTGLGLALVRHFTENMGGRVSICNNFLSPGCTAEVQIPLARNLTA